MLLVGRRLCTRGALVAAAPAVGVRWRSSDVLTDRWTLAHSDKSAADRRWPRPRSPLASFEDGADVGEEAWEEVEAWEIGEASRLRLPPMDEAQSFDDYVQEVHSVAAHAVSTAAAAQAEQIRQEAHTARERRRQAKLEPPPRPGPLVDDEETGPSPPPRGPLPEGAKPTGSHGESLSVARASLREAISSFDLTPRLVKQHLDEHVIAQETAKRALSVAVCDHYNFARRCVHEPALAEIHHVKPNVLLLGPSGVGKTHLMRALAKV